MHAASSAAAAGKAAAVRATECHTRLEQLRDTTRATTEGDVARANEALIRAAIRAALAAERSAEALRTTATLPGAGFPDAVGATSLSLDEREAGTYEVQYERMVMLGIAVDELWLHYVGLCGTYSQLEIEAYLHGALELGQAERARIDQALWELEDSR